MQRITSDNLQPLDIKIWRDDFIYHDFWFDDQDITIFSPNGYSVLFAIENSSYFNSSDYKQAMDKCRIYADELAEILASLTMSHEDRMTYVDLGHLGVQIRRLLRPLIIMPQHVQEALWKQIDYDLKSLYRDGGYIYLLRAIMPDTSYKIGYSSTPKERIESMGVKLPFPIKPLHLIPTNNVRHAEKYLHHLYAQKRLGGEWFQLSNEDVQSICNLNELFIGEVS